ncbi:MAG TPA: AAC(3) family N-acetyltransferase [Candidatus Polarisedimenticolia bacterium]|nr:AAC(3) family N-acetyltransferase [Candidatus Polarisedimenticolia bacterium]
MRPVARRLQSLNNRVFKRITREEIREGLVRLGLEAGATVYAHVSMRRLGYVADGPAEVVGAIMDVVGPSGTLMMAACPAEAPSRVDPGALFDVLETPSRSGLLSEALRVYPASTRSLHPIASVAAVGAKAEDLVAGHARSVTPFGPESPYAKLIQSKPRFLLIGAHLGPLLYHIQDRVGFPNLYTAEPVTFEVRDAEQRYLKLPTLALRAEVPSVVILPGSRPESRDYLLIPDYAVMFPTHREREVLEAGYLRFNRSRFLGRRERLQARGILSLGRIGQAEAALFDGARLTEQIAKDLAWDLGRFKEEYDAEQLSGLSLPIF